MRDLLCVSPVLYLIFFSDLFLRIRECEYRPAALGGDCHFGFLLFVSATLSLSVYLPPLSPLTPLFIHPAVSLCLPSYLTYSCFPSAPPILLPLFLFLFPFFLPWRPWAYSFHWQFLLAWEGYQACLIASFLLYSFRVSLAVCPMHIATHTHTHTHTLT